MNAGAGAPAPFDVSGHLPAPGITVLEASAGTGKTFTLTALITRFLAEGVPLAGILAVTFTRMATSELRDRIRYRLVTAEDRLARHLRCGEPVRPDDQVVAHLADAPRPTVEVRHARLTDALAAFDAATIATTHGFCHLVLDGLGSAGDVAAGTILLEDPADLVDEVVDDLYLRRALQHGPPPFTRGAARAAASQAVANPDILLFPPAGEDPSGLLSRLAGKSRTEVARRLHQDNLLTYDHLLSRLADTLDDPERGALACRRLRQRYQVVLVDEFQDTDPVQWRIMRTAFGDGATTLVLVGDPKQAIYSFRGADVHAYLDAAERAATYTLTQNWRADQPLLDATDALLAPLQFGHEAIRFRSVRAPADRQQAGTQGFPRSATIRVRLVDSRQPGIQKTKKTQLLQTTALADWIAGDVARDIAGLLASGARVAGTGTP
ncbi:MAG: UvrD-helicase domain-containing protein, partial [Acidimicrobiales bacterium]